MTTPYARHYAPRETPQDEPIPGSAQVPNSAGGYAWQIDDWQRLDRFLILGTEGGTYYIGERKLTLDNAEAVRHCIAADGQRVVKQIVAISHAGRAAKNDPAIFALAMCSAYGDTETKRAANDALPRVCRIGTHLFHFAAYVQSMRGWGRGLKTAVARWYEDKTSDALAEQLIKYQQRDGWSHKDLIKLSHPRAERGNAPLYDWVLGDRAARKTNTDPGTLPADIQAIIDAFEAAQRLADDADGKRNIVRLIQTARLPRECVPTFFLNYPEVWESLLIDMPMEAMVRNLGSMSKVGFLRPLTDALREIVDRLGDAERIKRSRIHPIKLLTALKVYQSGAGIRGSGTWKPVSQVIDALDAAFYTAFANVEPTGKNHLLALDISGSMSLGSVAGAPLTPREASAAMALVTAATEPNYAVMGFATTFAPLNISPRQRLSDVIAEVSRLPMGGTDCALPMQYALKERLNVDAFVVYTDSETWAGRIGHPSQWLQRYRAESRKDAKLVVCAMLANPFSIADPNDSGMLDVVGFDTDTPAAIAEFMR